MSRALNLAATEADVTMRCAKLNASITSIETLHSGGTRVVLKNALDAVAVAKSYGAKVLAGAVTRQPTRLTYHRPAEPAAAASRPFFKRD